MADGPTGPCGSPAQSPAGEESKSAFAFVPSSILPEVKNIVTAQVSRNKFTTHSIALVSIVQCGGFLNIYIYPSLT